MSNVVCVKCSAEGDSKCPYCRSIFPDWPEGDTDGEKFVWFDVEALEHRLDLSDPAKVTFQLCRDETPEKFLQMLRKAMIMMKENHVKVLACAHSFKFKEGHSSSIDCGH